MMVKSVEDQIDVWIVNDSKYMIQLLSKVILYQKITLRLPIPQGMVQRLFEN